MRTNERDTFIQMTARRYYGSHALSLSKVPKAENAMMQGHAPDDKVKKLVRVGRTLQTDRNLILTVTVSPDDLPIYESHKAIEGYGT